jgi:general stress protein 26
LGVRRWNPQIPARIRFPFEIRILGMSTLSSTDQRENFLSLLKEFDTLMLVTLNSEHEFHGRPMAVAAVEPGGRLWFLTGKDTGKVHEIEMDSHAYLTAQDGNSAFLTLSGRASLIEDRDKVHELWDEGFKVWFPGGKDDPNIELIAVQPESGEYWDTTGGRKVKYLWESAKAYASGTTPQVEEPGQHGRVRL